MTTYAAFDRKNTEYVVFRLDNVEAIFYGLENLDVADVRFPLGEWIAIGAVPSLYKANGIEYHIAETDMSESIFKSMAEDFSRGRVKEADLLDIGNAVLHARELAFR